MKKAIKLANGLWWIKSFEDKRINIVEDYQETDPQYELECEVTGWMALFLKKYDFSFNVSCWDSAKRGDWISQDWHQDYMEATGDKTLFCIMADDKGGNTEVKIFEDNIISLPPWNVYAMNRQLWHRGPKNKSIRYVARLFFESRKLSLEELFGEEIR